MARKRAKHKKDREARKGKGGKLRQFLGISADTIQIAEFLATILKPVLAKAAIATALVGGTVIVGKTIIHEKTNVPAKDTNTKKVITEPALSEGVIGEGEENMDIVEETPSVTPRTITSTPTTPAITVEAGWGHITLDSSIAAFYMLIHNKGAGADRLVGGSSKVCSRVGLQDMTITGPSGHEGDDVPFSVGLPAGSSVELKFGGQRILCYGVGGVELGDLVPLTLSFEKYGEVTTMIEIREPLESWPTPGPP